MLNKLVVDVEGNSIRLVYGSFIGGRARVLRQEELALPQNVMIDGRMTGLDDIGRLIRDYLKSNRWSPATVSFVLHSSRIFVKTLQLPRMSSQNIHKSIEWEMLHLYQLKPEKYCFSYEVLCKMKTMLSLLVIIVPVELVEQYDALSRRLGVRLLHIEPASKCLQRLMKNQYNNFGFVYYDVDCIRFALYARGRLFAENEFYLGGGMETGAGLDPCWGDSTNGESEEGAQEAAATAMLMPTYTDTAIAKNLESFRSGFDYWRGDPDRIISAFRRMVDFFNAQRDESELEYIFFGGIDPPDFLLQDYIEKHYVKPINLQHMRSNPIGAKGDGNRINLFCNALGLFVRSSL